MTTNTDWMQCELRITKANADLATQSLRIYKIAQQLNPELCQELEEASDNISEAQELISAAMTIYRTEGLQVKA